MRSRGGHAGSHCEGTHGPPDHECPQSPHNHRVHVRSEGQDSCRRRHAAASAAASAAAAADDPGEDTPKKKKEKARREEKRRREEEDMKRKLKKIENSAEEKSKEANVALRSAAGLFTDVSNPSSCISGRLLIYPPLLIRSCPPPCLR